MTQTLANMEVAANRDTAFTNALVPRSTKENCAKVSISNGESGNRHLKGETFTVVKIKFENKIRYQHI